jgi:uncharacterized membrane protein YoaT (DUF817 family)
MWTWSRAISLIVALWYVIIAVYFGDLIWVIRTVTFCALPLSCIWFADAMAAYRGISTFPKQVDESSPPSFIYIMGWILLFLPVLSLLLILYLQSLE